MNQRPFVDELKEQLERGIPRRAQRDKRLRLAAGGTALVGIVGAITTLALLNNESATLDQVDVGPATSAAKSAPPTSAASDLSTNEGSTPDRSLTDLPPPDPPTTSWGEGGLIRPGHAAIGDAAPRRSAMIWTGTELVLYGRSEEHDKGDQEPAGLVYRPGTDNPWQELPPIPAGELFDAVGVWSGSEVIVCCGSGDNRRAAAWQPETNTWRSYATAPIGVDARVTSAVWADGRLVLFAGTEALVYEPGLSFWVTFETPLLAPVGVSTAVIDHRVVVWPKPLRRTTSTGWLFDTRTGQFTPLPSPPVEAFPAIADVAWTGEEVILLGGLPGATAGGAERLVGARLNLDSMEWQALPDVFPEPNSCECNLGSQSMTWVGDRLIVSLGHLGSGINAAGNATFAYQPSVDKWWELDSVGAVSWQRDLVVMNDRVAFEGDPLTTVSFDALRAGIAVPATGVPAGPTVVFEDLPWNDVALTLVGYDVQGSVAVIDGTGFRSIADADDLSTGRGSLDGMSMNGDSLYLWRTDGQVHHYHNGPRNSDGDLNRLVGGALYQHSRITQTTTSEQTILPLADGQAWITEPGRVRLVDMATSQTLRDVAVDGETFRVGTLATSALVLHATSDTQGFVGGVLVDTNGEVSAFTDEPVLGVTGSTVISQSCDDNTCHRTKYEFGGQGDGDPTVTRFESDPAFEYRSVAGPMWPSHAAPLAAGSPGGRYLLVRRAAVDRSPPGYDWIDLALVDIESGQTTSLLTSARYPNLSVATWSRDGRHIVTLSNETDLATIDLLTGDVAFHTGIVPEGFGVLAAG